MRFCFMMKKDHFKQKLLFWSQFSFKIQNRAFSASYNSIKNYFQILLFQILLSFTSLGNFEQRYTLLLRAIT